MYLYNHSQPGHITAITYTVWCNSENKMMIIMNREAIIITVLTVLAPRPYYSHFSHIFVKADVVKIINLMMHLAFQNELQRKRRPAQGVIKPADDHSAFPFKHLATGNNLTCRSQLPQCYKCYCSDRDDTFQCHGRTEDTPYSQMSASTMKMYLFLLDS